jgi:hypothetical protein
LHPHFKAEGWIAQPISETEFEHPLKMNLSINDTTGYVQIYVARVRQYPYHAARRY